MTATLLLIRHAEHVEYGRVLSGRRAGVALSERGRAQAERLAEQLAGAGLAGVQSSPVERARATAAAVASRAGVEAEVAEAIDEIDFGAWEGRAFDSLAGDPEWDRWNAERGSARCPGGETMREAQARAVAHVERVAAAHPGATVALISHSDVVKAIVAHALSLPLGSLLRFDIDPASVSRLAVGDWGMRVMGLNERVGE